MKRIVSFEVIVVLLMVIAAYGYFFSGTDWNTNSRLAMIKAVVEENRFEIDSFHRSGLITRDEASLRGHFYTDKAIGSMLIGIEFYFPIYLIAGGPLKFKLFNELIGFLAISLICAFLAPFLYSFAKRISNSAWFALLVTIAICLGTQIYKYSTFYYGHVLAGLFLFTAFFIWFCMKDEEPLNRTKVMISGYFLGYTVLTEYPTAVLAFGVGLYILYVLWQKRSLSQVWVYLRLGLGASIPIVLLLAYNTAVFGHPFKTGYGYEIIPEFLEGQHGGIMGLEVPRLDSLFYMTFHTTMGVFWQSPVLLCAFWGWVRMGQNPRYRAEMVFSLGVVVVYFLMMSGYFIWWGGAAFTPRNLIPVLPFFGIPLAFLLRKWEKRWLAVFTFISVAQMFVVVAGSDKGIIPILDKMRETSIYTMFQPNSIIYNVYLPNFLNQLFGINRGQEFFNLDGFASLLPLFALEVGLLVVFAKLAAKRNAATVQPVKESLDGRQPEI